MRIWVIIALLLLSAKPIVAQQPSTQVEWLTFEQLSDSLAVSPKRVLLFFHTDWCGYCKKMLKETFVHPQIVRKLNEEYYAVQFDTEQTDTVYFEGQTFANTVPTKTRGCYHDIFTLLHGGNQNVVFPYTILLDEDFTILHTKRKYLSIKDLLNIL